MARSQKKNDATKAVRIACRGARLAALEELTPLQGSLKELSRDSYEQLRQGLIKYGYCFPIKVWEDAKGKLWIVGGHQTALTLGEMKIEGYQVPRLPISLIEARSKKEARRLVLVDASSYGKIDKQGLYEFMIADGIDPGEMASSFRLPEINLPRFNIEFFADDVTGKPPKEKNDEQIRLGEQPQEPASKEQYIPEAVGSFEDLPPKQIGDVEPLPPPDPRAETAGFHHKCPRCGFRFD